VARSHHLGAAVLAVATLGLTGCPLNHSSTLTTSSSSSSSSPSSSASPSPSEPSTPSSRSDDREAPPSHALHGIIVRSQLESLRGLTPDEARAKLKQYGHDGEVKLDTVIAPGGGPGYDKNCGVNRVCDTSGNSGVSVHDAITLLLNPTLTIAPPPP